MLSNRRFKMHFLKYLKQNRRIIVLYFFVQCFFTGSWILYHNDEILLVLYPVLVTTIVGLVAFLLGFVPYYKKITQLEKVLIFIEENDRGPESFHVQVHQEEEKMLLEIAEELISKFKALEERHFIKEADRESYYALWSHQIKTPITSLKLLLEETDGGENPQINRYQMLEEILKIEQYMDMVLHYNRIGDMSKDLVIEDVELQKTVHQVLKKYSILFINRRFQIVVDVPEVRIVSDKKWLTLVIEQILSNAIKYTESGHVRIRAFQEKDLVRLVIEDTGIGIRAEDIDRVFEKGFTGYNGRLDQRASGIGLFLVKKVMDQLKHSITVESRVGEGTKVVLTFGNLTKM